MQLEFKIEEQTLSLTSKQNVVADSLNYLTCKFTFSEEWNGLIKTAVFVSNTDEVFSTILADDACSVPYEVIESPSFRVSVFGGNRITTNIVTVNVTESGYMEGDTPSEPTPDVYTQILNNQALLNSLFKGLPEGKTIDDLQGEEFTGCYILVNPKHMGYTGLLYVTFGVYSNNEKGEDVPCTYQTRYILEPVDDGSGNNVKIERRNDAYGWSDWKDVFATLQYVDEKTDFFKKVPKDMTIDDLYGEEYFGWYMNDSKSKWSGDVPLGQQFEILFVNDGYYRDETIGDLGCYSQTRFVWNGHDFNIQTRYHNFQKWSDWQDAFATPEYVKEQIDQIPTGGGGATFFESSTPQIDITLEEPVQSMTITELSGQPLAEYNYTTMKVVMDNAKLSTTGTNSEITIRLNQQGLAEQNACSLNAPTTFINNSTKQSWGGHINLAENLFLSGSNATGNEYWRITLQMPVNTSKAMEYEKIETVFVNSTATEMPIGTRIKIWFK